ARRSRLYPRNEFRSLVLMPSDISMRQQWFTHVRLLVAHLTRSRRAFSATLKTPALDRSPLRWFGLSACTASPKGQPSSLAQHGHAGDLLHRHHSPFRTHKLVALGVGEHDPWLLTLSNVGPSGA